MLALLIALVGLGLAWELWLAPTGARSLALKVLPLAWPLAGIWAWRLASVRALSLLVWLYVAEGAMRAATEHGVSAQLAWVGTAAVRGCSSWPACCTSAAARGAACLLDERHVARRAAAAVGATQVLTEGDLSAYELDWRRRWRGKSLAVVRPGSTDEVAQVVRACAAARVSIVAQGGNTGLVGGGVPDDSGRQVLLSLDPHEPRARDRHRQRDDHARSRVRAARRCRRPRRNRARCSR